MLVKRLCDLVSAFLLMVVTSPILFVIAVVTMIELRCIPIFKEKRIGFGGIPFDFYKVVSMKPSLENLAARNLGPIQKNDPRLTKFGRFIRRYSLDELPQFCCIVKGDMSLIGPRPIPPPEVEEWSRKLPEYMRRFSVLPGMSGWAQINGYRKGYIEPEKRLAHDLYYIDNWSLVLDTVTAIRTPWAILRWEVW